jgi:hypothetical protein
MSKIVASFLMIFLISQNSLAGNGAKSKCRSSAKNNSMQNVITQVEASRKELIKIARALGLKGYIDESNFYKSVNTEAYPTLTSGMRMVFGSSDNSLFPIEIQTPYATFYTRQNFPFSENNKGPEAMKLYQKAFGLVKVKEFSTGVMHSFPFITFEVTRLPDGTFLPESKEGAPTMTSKEKERFLKMFNKFLENN